MPRIKDLILRGSMTSTQAESLYGPSYDPNTMVELSPDLGSALITVTEMTVEQGSSWVLPAYHSMQLYIGPSSDLSIEGNSSILGDALITTYEKGIRVSGTLSVTGTCLITEMI